MKTDASASHIPVRDGPVTQEDIILMAAQFQELTSSMNKRTDPNPNSFSKSQQQMSTSSKLGGPPMPVDMHDDYDDDADWDFPSSQSGGVPTVTTYASNAPDNPYEEYDGYAGDGLWDFGDSVQKSPSKEAWGTPTQGNYADSSVHDGSSSEVPAYTAGNSSYDLDELTKANPLVSPSWLKNTLEGNWSTKPHLDPSERRAVKGPVEVDKTWLKRVEVQWASLKSKDARTAFTQLLSQCFSTVVNPFITALYLIEKSNDYFSGKSSSLAFNLLKEFERWAHKQHPTFHSKHLDQWIMLHAFQVGTHSNMCMLDLIVKAYKLQDMKEVFLPCIRQMLQERQFKEAAQCTTKLGLQSHFEVQDIVLPLIIQDKVNLVENYVYRNSEQQMALLKLLDYLVDPNTEIALILLKLDIPDVNRDKLVPKILSKLAVRLLKLYNIPQDVCPNIHNNRTTKALRHLLYKKYMEETMDGEQWDDLIQGTVENSAYLQEYLIEQLLDNCDATEALRWARHFNIPESRLPHQLVGAIVAMEAAENYRAAAEDQADEGDWDDHLYDSDTQSSQCSSSTTSTVGASAAAAARTRGPPPPATVTVVCPPASESSAVKHHTLALPEDAIIWVNTRPGFYESVDYLSQDGSVIGFDAEWRPTFGQSVNIRMSVLQLAVQDRVYLWDMLELPNCLHVQDWCHFAEQVFANDRVLKLGYGMDGDLQLLVKMVPGMKEPLGRTQRLVDLHVLHRHVLKLCPGMFDKGEGEAVTPGSRSAEDVKVVKQEERGLSDMVRQCLGRPLDKSQQVSDWEKRPLRQKQILYAALDAYVLVEVYEVMKLKIKEHNLEIDLEPSGGHSVHPRKTKLQKRQQKVAERLLNAARPVDIKEGPSSHSQDCPQIKPREFRVVVDNMLQGLGKQLRSCGVDVIILGNDEDHERAADIARAEGRIILTSGLPYQTLRSQVGEGRCLCVSPGKAREQVEEVLDHYNVKVTQNDIFSRCQVCNGGQYLFVKSAELHRAWKKKRSRPPMLQAAMEKRAKSQMAATAAGDPNSANYFQKTDDSTNDPEVYHINMELLCLEGGVPLQVETVPEPVFQRIDLFFVCATCGKVFWEGAHFERVCEQFSHVLEAGSGRDSAAARLQAVHASGYKGT